MFWWERVRSAFSTVASYHSRNMMMLFSFDPSHQPRDYPSWLLWSRIKPTARSQFLKSKSHSFSGCLFVFLYCLNNLHFIWFTLGVSRWTITTALCVPCCFSILPRQTQNTHRKQSQPKLGSVQEISTHLEFIDFFMRKNARLTTTLRYVLCWQKSHETSRGIT